MNKKVFVNCPFDKKFLPILQAICFAVLDCGYQPSLALDEDDAGEARLDKIIRLIRAAGYGIHDLSAISVSSKSPYPRFNMPFELGLFFGAVKYGASAQRQKKTLIFEGEKYSYQKTLSDISGQDAKCHNNQIDDAIAQVRTFFSKQQHTGTIPGAKAISSRYKEFLCDLPTISRKSKISTQEMRSFAYLGDFIEHARAYLELLDSMKAASPV